MNKQDCILRLKIQGVWKEYRMNKVSILDTILSEDWVDHRRSSDYIGSTHEDKIYRGAFFFSKKKHFEFTVNMLSNLDNDLAIASFYFIINDPDQVEFELICNGEKVSSEIFRNQAFEITSNHSLRNDSEIDMEKGEVIDIHSTVNTIEIPYSDKPWELKSVLYKKVEKVYSKVYDEDRPNATFEIEINFNHSDKETPW